MREHRHFAAQVRTDDQQRFERIDLRDAPAERGHGGIGDVAGEIHLAQTVVHVQRAQARGQLREQCVFLDGARRTGEHAETLRRCRGKSVSRRLQRRRPVGFLPAAIARAHHGHLQAIRAVDALVAEAVAIGDPALVDRFVLARHHAHEPPTQHVPVEVGAEAVVRRDQRVLRHFPRPRAVAERLAVERADRTQVDDVARQLVVDALLDVGADLAVLATVVGAEFLHARDVLPEAHAARAVDAARHVGGDEWTDVLVLDHALALVVARNVAAIAHGQILQLAFAALIADRAVERMIDQQEFHHRLLRSDGLRGTRVDDHALGHRRGAGGQRLRRLLHLDETHAAVRGHGQFLVVAEARDVDVMGVRDADDHLALARLHRHAIHGDVDAVVRHRLAHAATCCAVTRLRPPWSIMYSNSCR